MSGSDFDVLVDRRGTGSEKWDRYAGRDIIPLWVADMDFRSPPAVLDALKQRVDHGVFGYTRPPKQLVEAVVDYLSGSYGWHVQPDWIIWLPGLVTGLNVSCRAAGAPGDEVVTPVPIYPPFLSAPVFSNRRPVRVPMALDGNRWAYDLDALQKRITRRTCLLLLCNPHNPVGRVLDRSELEALAECLFAHDIIVCSDEIHCDLILNSQAHHVPLASLTPDIADRTITLMAPSKTYNIPGLGCAFAIIPNARVRRRFKSAMAGIVPHVNVMGFVAAEAAYRHGRQWLRELIAYLRENRDAVDRAVRKMPGLSSYPVEGTYLTWIDARPMGAGEPVKLFETAGVGLSDGREFGADGFLRLNFGCPRSRLTEGLERMAAAVNAAA
jgi:cystathionine beta-lyase